MWDDSADGARERAQPVLLLLCIEVREMQAPPDSLKENGGATDRHKERAQPGLQ